MDQAPRQEIMGYNYASIVVDAGPSPDVRWLLEAARAFAATYGGKLIAVAHAWPRTSLVQETLRPSSILSAQMTTMSLEASLATTRSIYEEIVAGGKVEGEWCGAVGEPLPPLCEHALTADLVIVSNERHEGFQSVDPTEVARRTGTPVLKLASGSPTAFRRIVIGWKDSRQARDAVHDVLPLLARAEAVVVAGIGDEVTLNRLKDVAAHLARHGVSARPIHLANAAGVSSQILNLAREEGADLLVTGAYSRTRNRERIFGGVTRDLSESTELSWFFAH